MSVIDEIMKRFENLISLMADNAEKYDYDKGSVEAYKNAIKIVQEVAEKYNDWLNCNERLPEDGTDVLVQFEYYRYGSYNRLFQTIGISYTYNGEWSGFVNGSSGWSNLRIIA